MRLEVGHKARELLGVGNALSDPFRGFFVVVLPAQLFCSSAVTLSIEALDGAGKPNGTILSPAQTVNFSGTPTVIPLSTPFAVTAGSSRFAVVLSLSSGSCNMSGGTTSDGYAGGAAYPLSAMALNVSLGLITILATITTIQRILHVRAQSREG